MTNDTTTATTTSARSPNVADRATGVATGRVADGARVPPELERLNIFIGRWLTEGESVASVEGPAMPIFASDIYEWGPGGRFVIHTAYGRIGDIDVGGVEIIGYDADTNQYRTHFFDNQGNTTEETLSNRDGDWIWEGAHTRCTGVISADGKSVVASHERSDDGIKWAPSMTVTLKRVD